MEIATILIVSTASNTTIRTRIGEHTLEKNVLRVVLKITGRNRNRHRRRKR